ncbi:hypothetical protein [Paludisphaera rhizosphaerae]|uniref:hypothetical protein n=1 Tax=Paludisphaera rhizosphaerae TaxID=2711216 RepID=UPI0013ED543C|nr:hypothetical protein [Paludisphaera rhizosphaerae]
MKKSLTYLASAGLLTASLFAVGCGETSSVTQHEEIKGPGGTTEIEHKDTVKTTGENPPVVAPAEKPATP